MVMMQCSARFFDKKNNHNCFREWDWEWGRGRVLWANLWRRKREEGIPEETSRHWKSKRVKILVKKEKKKERDKDVELKTVEEINQSINRWRRREEKKKETQKEKHIGLSLDN